MSSFCGYVKTDGVFHLKLTGADGHNYLSKEVLNELRLELAKIRAEAAASETPCRGLITSASAGGSYCDGIDYARLRARSSWAAAKEAKALSDGLAGVVKELLAMPMVTVCAATGNATSLGLALALAHDHMVVVGDANYKLGMVEDGVAVQPHVAALIREKTDRWYTLTTLQSRNKNGNWMKRWCFADVVADTPEDVLREAGKLVGEWTGSNGDVHAGMRRQLYCESWKAVSAIVPGE